MNQCKQQQLGIVRFRWEWGGGVFAPIHVDVHVGRHFNASSHGRGCVAANQARARAAEEDGRRPLLGIGTTFESNNITCLASGLRVGLCISIESPLPSALFVIGYQGEEWEQWTRVPLHFLGDTWVVGGPGARVGISLWS